MNFNKKKINLFKKIFIIIIFFCFNNIISFIYLFDFYIKNEILKIEMYFKYCKNNIKKILKFKKINNPKISVISPVYNREKFIPRFIGSLQKQNFKEIEIILIDDKSIDNSAELIEKYKKEDKRIVLIKNKKNRGTFVSRNLGILLSKSKYVIIPDPDDIISKEIITICYNYGEKYNYDIIRFISYEGHGEIISEDFVKFHTNRPIYQPELSTYMYYGNRELEIIDFYINDKLINKKTYIEALNSINIFYFKFYMTLMEDTLMNYLLYRTAKSLYFMKKIGYRYMRTSESISNKIFMLSTIRIKFVFNYIKIIFDFSKNSKYEKDMFNFLFNRITKNFNIINVLSELNFNNDFYFYYEIINRIINCIYISNENMNLLYKLKEIIEQKNPFKKLKTNKT